MRYNATTQAVVSLLVVFTIAVTHADITGAALVRQTGITAITNTITGIPFLNVIAKIAIF